MSWLLLLGAALLLLAMRGPGGTLAAMLVVAAALTVLLFAFSFLAGALVLFLWNPDALRAWKLPSPWLDRLFDGNLLVALGLFPFVVLADIARGILHVLLRHPHPVLWAFMVGGCAPLVPLWRNAAGAIAAHCARRRG